MKIEKSILNDNLYKIDELIQSAINLIDVNIPDFLPYFDNAINEYKNNSEMAKNTLEQEDDVSIILRRFLCDIDSEFDFEFQTKTPEKNGGTDIGILRKYSKPRHLPFCIIEAKRLPTPIYNGSQQTEYVCYKSSTKQGGIERFKTNRHGAKLPQSLMIAYIQAEPPSFWFSKVNSWIDDEISFPSNSKIEWKDIEKLMQDNSFSKPKVTKYNSEHSRISNSNIKLSHYWIDLV